MISLITLSGCGAFDVIALGAATINGGAAYVNKQTANTYKVIADQRTAQIKEFIPKECKLIEYKTLDTSLKALLIRDIEGRKLLEDIAKDNIILEEKCPNIERPVTKALG